MGTSSASLPVMTPRKQRGLEIFARERELRTQQSAFDRERTRIFTETGHKVSGKESQVGGEEKAVRAELRALAAERARLLEEITAREAELRARQATFDRTRSAGAGTPGQGKKAPVTRAEQEIRTELALLQRACLRGRHCRPGPRVSNERRRDLEHLPRPGHLQQGRLVTACN